MYDFLQGLRIVEGASFIAAPSCGLHLAQMGAEVIRFDTIGGGPDFDRWPLAPNGASFYWEGLNKGKKSIALDLKSAEGRQLARTLIAAPGEAGGLFLTNFPAGGFLSHEHLAELREDLITLRVMGHADGTTALDYTVNCAVGLPQMTGPASLGDEPVNHVLPAWDLMAGAYGAFSLMVAERHRRATGQGLVMQLPLTDMAIASLGHLGQIAEASAFGRDRPRYGNDLYGAFGRDFLTRDGRRIMYAAITQRQWSGLIKALDIEAPVAALEQSVGTSFSKDAGERFRHRDALNKIVAAHTARFTYGELVRRLGDSGACWGPYRTLHEALTMDPAFSTENPMMSMVSHVSGHTYPTPGAATSVPGVARRIPSRAPRLGEHTDQVLAEVLGMDSHQIGVLHDRQVVAGPKK